MSSTYIDGTTPLDASHLNALQQKVEKGVANGYASLDSGGKVPVAQALPTVVNGQWLKGVGGAAVWSPFATDALSATPPGSPVDGQLWGLSPASGIVWMFRYNAGSASAYKWEFVGGSPLENDVQADAGTASTTYVYPSPGTPVITLPRAGDYLFDWGALCTGDSATLRNAWMGPNGGNYVVSDTNAALWVVNNVGSRATRQIVAAGVTASAIQLAVRSTVSTTTWGAMYFRVTPIRVS